MRPYVARHMAQPLCTTSIPSRDMLDIQLLLQLFFFFFVFFFFFFFFFFFLLVPKGSYLKQNVISLFFQLCVLLLFWGVFFWKKTDDFTSLLKLSPHSMNFSSRCEALIYNTYGWQIIIKT